MPWVGLGGTCANADCLYIRAPNPELPWTMCCHLHFHSVCWETGQVSCHGSQAPEADVSNILSSCGLSMPSRGQLDMSLGCVTPFGMTWGGSVFSSDQSAGEGGTADLCSHKIFEGGGDFWRSFSAACCSMLCALHCWWSGSYPSLLSAKGDKQCSKCMQNSLVTL